MIEVMIVLAVDGVLLLIIELFVPGMVAGIAGLFALIAAVVLGFVNYGFDIGVTLMAALVLFGSVGFFWWTKAFPASRAGQALALQRSVGGAMESLLGKTGKALTPLRPSGTAMIDDRRVDVVAESDLISAGEPVTVVLVEGHRVVVQRA
jgi:membrane-bound ClpP family serine protease